MQLFLELTAEPGPIELTQGGADLAAFLSFAAMRGFGAQHPLIALADRLHGVYAVPMGPLSHFYEAEPEDSEDRERLELAWQPASTLSEALTRALEASTDAQAVSLLARAGTPTVFEGMQELLALLQRQPNSKARMTYAL